MKHSGYRNYTSMLAIISPAKSSRKAAAARTSGRSCYSRMAWTSLTLIALLLWLATQPATAGLVKRYQRLVDINLYSMQADLRKPCKTKPGNWVAGCATTSRQKVVIHALQPQNWCDWKAIHVVGHELMHGLGFHHYKGFMFTAKNEHVLWTGGDCRMYD